MPAEPGPRRYAVKRSPPVRNSNIVLIDRHPGRSTQTLGIARELGTDPDLIHEQIGRAHV